jgi:hypothetical protein
MFEETFILEKQLEDDLFGNLDFNFILNLANNNELIFACQITEEEPLSRTNITENMIPDNTLITPLITERQARIEERGISAEQEIISRNYHNIFYLNQLLVNTSQNYLQQIVEAVEQFQYAFENPIVTIQNIFRVISQNFISVFLTIIDDRNNMLDSTRDLVLNYELFYANNIAATNTFISVVINILKSGS